MGASARKCLILKKAMPGLRSPKPKVTGLNAVERANLQRKRPISGGYSDFRGLELRDWTEL